MTDGDVGLTIIEISLSLSVAHLNSVELNIPITGIGLQDP